MAEYRCVCGSGAGLTHISGCNTPSGCTQCCKGKGGVRGIQDRIVRGGTKDTMSVKGGTDYKFNTIKESRNVLKNEVKQVRTIVDNYVNNDVRGASATTTTTTSSPVMTNAPMPTYQLDKKFMQMVKDGLNSRGCEFIHNKFQTLTSQLNMMQNNGENPRGCQIRIAQINHIYNVGLKNGCWDGRQSPNAPVMPMGESKPNPYANPMNPYVNSEGFSNTDSLNTGKPDPRLAFSCKKSNASYGVGKINGRIRGDIKRPL